MAQITVSLTDLPGTYASSGADVWETNRASSARMATVTFGTFVNFGRARIERTATVTFGNFVNFGQAWGGRMATLNLVNFTCGSTLPDART